MEAIARSSACCGYPAHHRQVRQYPSAANDVAFAEDTTVDVIGDVDPDLPGHQGDPRNQWL